MNAKNYATLPQLVDSFKHGIRFLLKWKKAVIFFILLGGIIGYFYATSQDKIYIASVVYSLEDEKSSSGSGMSGLVSQLGIDVGGSGGGIFSGSNISELFKTRSIVEKALKSKILINGKPDSLIRIYKSFNKSDSDNDIYKSAKNIINSNIFLKKKQESPGIHIVEINSTNEIFAKYFAEEIVHQVASLYIQTKTEKLTTNIRILQHQVDSIRAELNSSIDGVNTVNDQTFNLNPAFTIKKGASTKSQINVQFNTSVLAELIKNLEMSKFKLLDQTPLISIIETPRFPLEFSKRNPILFLFAGSMVGFIMVSMSLYILSIYQEQNIKL